MKIRSTAAIAAFAGVTLVAAAAPALAMGSGNPFQDMQDGVTYTVYQPGFTAGLKARHVGPNLFTDPGVDQNLAAIYGKTNGRNVNITEGNPMSSDIGVGRLVKTLKIQGRTAKVYAYCDEASTAKCTLADIGKVGGHVDVTLPAASSALRDTRVWVETIRPTPISGQQLIKVAKGLKPVM